MVKMPLTKVRMHTDGSCLGNPGPGGWAVRLESGGRVKHLSGGFIRTTNNRMEITAVLEGLSVLIRPCIVELYTDSRYVCDAVEKGWLTSWQRNGWRKADKSPVLNKDLWERLASLLAQHKVKFHWVRGHAGHRENEEVDTIARESAGKSGWPADPGFIG